MGGEVSKAGRSQTKEGTRSHMLSSPPPQERLCNSPEEMAVGRGESTGRKTLRTRRRRRRGQVTESLAVMATPEMGSRGGHM